MSQQCNHPISPIICPNLRGRIREGEEDRDNQNERKRSRSPRGPRENIRESEEPNEQENQEDSEHEEEIVIPESERIPNTPTVEEYTKHQVTHYPFKAWCPICVKNAAQNNPHKKVKHVRETEVFSLDYMYMTSKPTTEEIVFPTLVIKASIKV